jgi:hypothetical protein
MLVLSRGIMFISLGVFLTEKPMWAALWTALTVLGVITFTNIQLGALCLIFYFSGLFILFVYLGLFRHLVQRASVGVCLTIVYFFLFFLGGPAEANILLPSYFEGAIFYEDPSIMAFLLLVILGVLVWVGDLFEPGKSARRS